MSEVIEDDQDFAEVDEQDVLAVPVPKRRIGDTIYLAHTERYDEVGQCPDCGNTKKWKVITGSGTEFEVPCERCDRAHYDVPGFKVTRFRGKVRPLVIKSITAATHGHYVKGIYMPSVSYSSGEGGGGYTCREDGEHFETEEAAMDAAIVKAAKEEAEYVSRDKEEVFRRRIYAFRIADAVAAKERKEARDWKWKYEKAVEEICDLKDGYVSGVKEDRDLELVARHLLERLDEDAPSEWGDN